MTPKDLKVTSGGSYHTYQLAWLAKPFHRMTGSSIIKAVYGYESTESNDPLLETVSSALQGFSQALLASSGSSHHILGAVVN
jgi:hypothetical protein